MIDKVKTLRARTIRRLQGLSSEKLNKPVTYWINEDRLLDKVGKEFTIILRTKGCSWALGDRGGCTMCGYIQDSCVDAINSDNIKNQFMHAWNNKLGEIQNDKEHYIIKIFNSGSFFDDDEIPEDLRKFIYEKIANVQNITEVVVESRTEHLSRDKLNKMRSELGNRQIEIGIGLETVNDYIRLNYINKGMTFKEFLDAVNLCKQCDIGIRAYLLFKPPFISEESAIDDCVDSIKTLIDMKINTISINPVNIQRGTLVEYLWQQNRYQVPSFYSLMKSLKMGVKSQEMLKNTRIVCDPSGAGSRRGIHSCSKRECNTLMKDYLKNFVLSQNIGYLKKLEEEEQCYCKLNYHMQKMFN
ncbi:MAG: archaeosine biosynthesis radical SAM protein RaSEA [Candidatus Lokiarchaeota archaeon]|nr:archaeosine biosynthesis radical SAM protein RaSEA [Candidatus Lokiarchaeota archaeon]